MKCFQLENAGKIESMWFWKNAVHAKVTKRINAVKIYHIMDIGKLLGITNVNEFISHTPFCMFQFSDIVFSIRFSLISLIISHFFFEVLFLILPRYIISHIYEIIKS